MGSLKNKKGIIVKNFISQDEVNLLKEYCIMKHKVNLNSFDTVQNPNGDTAFYGDPLMESLMINKKKIIEENVGKELLPTYTYWRLYSKFAFLKKHTDRPSCEISVTLMIDSDGKDWPLIIEDEEYHLKPGEAVIYTGTKHSHWRDSYMGDYHIQSFLHYVDKNGEFKDYHMDKRQFFGTQKRK